VTSQGVEVVLGVGDFRPIVVNITHAYPQTTYEVHLFSLVSDGNIDGYDWGLRTEPWDPHDFQNMTYWIVQYDNRLGITTVRNEWGRINDPQERILATLSGRELAQQTFLAWSLLFALLGLMGFGFVWVFVRFGLLSTPPLEQVNRLPFFSLTLIALTVAIYLGFGDAGVPLVAAQAYRGVVVSFCPMHQIWTQPFLRTLLSVFVHANYDHITGNMLGSAMLGVILAEAWLRLPRPLLALAYFVFTLFLLLPAFVASIILPELNFGLGIGASSGISAILGFATVALIQRPKMAGPLVAPRNTATGQRFGRLRRGIQKVWRIRNLIGLLVLGYVLIQFLWGWIGLGLQYWNGLLVGTSWSTYSGDPGLVISHLFYFAFGCLFAFLLPRFTQRRHSQPRHSASNQV
jgi:membrane associated rhomboid family serine protease